MTIQAVGNEGVPMEGLDMMLRFLAGQIRPGGG